MPDALLVRISASRPGAEGMAPDELLANLRVAPGVIAGDKGRAAFLGLVLEGAGQVHDAMQRRGWL